MPNIIIKERPDVEPRRDIFDNTDEGPVLDLGVDLEYYSGPIFVKFKDARAIGAAVGMVSEEEYNIAKESIEIMSAKIIELEEEIDVLRKPLINYLSNTLKSIAPLPVPVGEVEEDSIDDVPNGLGDNVVEGEQKGSPEIGEPDVLGESASSKPSKGNNRRGLPKDPFDDIIGEIS